MSITGTDVMWTELNDTLFFDFSATSIENYPFTDSDLDALRNLAVLIDTAKVLNQMHGKKPLRRDLIDFIIDKATNNHALRKAYNSYYLVSAGIPSTDRAKIMGHSPQTNERNYTFERLD